MDGDSRNNAAILDNIRVLELARVAPAQLPGMILADHGAHVLKIEAPDPHRSTSAQDEWRAVHSFVDRNKSSMILDLKATAGQEIFRKLAADADVIIEGFRPGVARRIGASYDELQKINPRLIHCALSGFGQSGPYRDYPAHDLNYISLGGVLNLIGDPGRKPVIPLNLVADLGGASLHATVAILLALLARERTGRGQYLDISYLDTTVSLLAATPNMRFFFSDGMASRRGEGFLGGSYPYYAIYETRDRKLLTIGCIEPWLWSNFCNAIGKPEFAQYGRKADHFARSANAAEQAARLEIESIMKTRDRDEWHDLLVQADVCVGKVYDVEEMVDDPQIRHRHMIVEADHPKLGRVKQFGIAIKMSATPGSVRRAAPLPGEHTNQVLKRLGITSEVIANLRAQKIVG